MFLRRASGLARVGRVGLANHTAGPAVVVAITQRRTFKNNLGKPVSAPKKGATKVQAWLHKVVPTDRGRNGAAAVADEGTNDDDADDATDDDGGDGDVDVDETDADADAVGIVSHDFTFARNQITLVPAELFAMPPRIDLLHRLVVWQRREWWQGTASAKVRGEVRGGGKKPWPQKGSGRARHGSRSSPIFRGGGVTHGPRPRDHSRQVPSKVKNIALRVALSVKYGQDDLYVVEDLVIPTWRTALLAPALKEQGWDTKTLFVGTGENAHFARAVGNIPKVDYIDESELNVYQMLLRHKLVLTRSAVDALFTRLVANEKVPTFLGSANDPAQDVAYVKPRYARDTRSKQSLRPSFLPSQSKKKPPKRVVRMYVSPRKGGRRYVDRKYAKVGGAIAKYSGRIGNKNVRASKEELEDDE